MDGEEVDERMWMIESGGEKMDEKRWMERKWMRGGG